VTLLVLSDDDTVWHDIRQSRADVLISCGDIYDQVILRVAGAVACSHILAVKGNHDFGAAFPSPIINLHLTTRTIAGVRFGGFEGSWKYKPRGHYLYEQEEVERLLASFPPVDVFVAHNSPRHIHDRNDDVHFGFEAFGRYIERAQPRLFLHGHQHVNQETLVGATRVIGVHGQRTIELPTPAA